MKIKTAPPNLVSVPGLRMGGGQMANKTAEGGGAGCGEQNRVRSEAIREAEEGKARPRGTGLGVQRAQWGLEPAQRLSVLGAPGLSPAHLVQSWGPVKP